MALSTRARARLAALPAIVLLALATAFVLREGLAELLAIEANERMAAWETGVPVTRGQFESVEGTLRRAMTLAPANGSHHEALGTAYFAIAAAPGRALDGRLRDFDRAAESYREAARLTPVSGYAWGNLMLTKHYAGQIDPEFSTALRNAARYAPHEAAVQAMIVGTVLPRWTQLDAEARTLAATTVARGWTDNRPVLLAEAKAAANRELWCDEALWPREAAQAAAMARLCAATAPRRAPAPNGPRRAP